MTRVTLGILAVLYLAVPASAQMRIVVSVPEAPIFVQPNTNLEPLRIAKQGSSLVVTSEESGWYRIEFQDPRLGRRVGFIERRFVQPERMPAIDVSVPDAPAEQRTQRQSPPAPHRLNLARTQRGDVTVGYVLAHETGATYPLGIAGSDAWRVHPNWDVVAEVAFAHGEVNALIADVGVNLFTFQGGIRGWGGSRYGDSVRAFGQVLAGLARATGSIGPLISDSTLGYVIQPGFGVEVPIASSVAIRPQFDIPFGKFEGGEFGRQYRFNVNAVFRLFHD
jgi:hypothetical protein